MTSLVTASKSQIVVIAVNGDMLIMSFAQLRDGFFNVLHTAGFAHCLAAIVSVTASTVPFTLEGFGMEGNFDTPLLGNADEKIPSHPKMVTHVNTFARAYLEFPLRWHHFGVDATDIDTGIKTSAVVGFNEITGKNLAGTYCRVETELIER